METISGGNNWRLTVRRTAEGAVILRAATCDERADLPETVLGLPVIALGDHALTPGAAPVPGEEIQMTCGPGEGEWDNRRLWDLSLPKTLRQAGDYALFNCGALKTLRLYDSVDRWGGGALMNCRLLDTLRIIQTEREGETLAYFAGELSRELDVTLINPSGETLRLLFPEYVELYEENCPAHHFDYNIQGAGYPYHHCFTQKRLDLRQYDRLWPSFLAMEHDPSAAWRMAFWRVRHPAGLTPEAEEGYLRYLRSRAGEGLPLLIRTRDWPGLRLLLDKAPPEEADLTAALDAARAGGETEAVAMLLEERRRRFPAGLEKSFDL